MAKKWNAYSLYVENEYRKLVRRGENVSKPQLYSRLDKSWKSLPEGLRHQYKEQAKRENPFPIIIDYTKTTLDDVTNNNRSGEQMDQSNNSNDRLTLNPGPSKTSQSTNEQARTEFKKRPHEDDEEDDDKVDTRVKKHKPGIPGWFKHEDDEKIESVRYKDYNLYVLRRRCEELIASRRDTLISKPIYSYSVNVLCQDQQGDYLPLEISIYSYNLKEGRTCEPYHVLIDPGDIPIGCYNVACDHEPKHHIAYPFGSEHRVSYVRQDYKRIYREMLKFTQDGERTLLLMNPQDLEQAKGSIEWLYKKATQDGSSLPRPTTWSIFLITDFVTALHNFIRQKMLNIVGPRFCLHYELRQLLSKGHLEYQPQYVCEYHKMPEKETVWCTRSVAIRTISNIEEILEQTYQLYQKATEQFLKITEGP